MARVFGAPPREDAPKVEHLRWVRRFYLWPLIVTVPVYVWALLTATETWIYLVLALSGLMWLQGVVSLGLQIRREQRTTSD